VSDQLHVLSALHPKKEPPVPTVQETEWALEPVWKPWRKEKSLQPFSRQSIVIPSELSRFLIYRLYIVIL
jgi:hypothetical protein